MGRPERSQDFQAAAAALQERRRNLALEARASERDEQEALALSLARSRAVARRQGVATEAPSPGEAGAMITARDGFTWLCGSRKRRPQLSEAQIAAGLRHRALTDAARNIRITADYDRLAAGGGAGGGRARSALGASEEEARLRRRLDAIDRLSRSETALRAAHPAIAMAVARVVGDGATLAALAAEQGKPEPAVLEVLRMGLDKLAEAYGFRSAGA